MALIKLSYVAQRESLSRIKMRLDAMEELASKRITGETSGRNERERERERERQRVEATSIRIPAAPDGDDTLVHASLMLVDNQAGNRCCAPPGLLAAASACLCTRAPVCAPPLGLRSLRATPAAHCALFQVGKP